MYSLIKSFLFLLSPESAHHVTTSIIKFLFKIPGIRLIFENTYSIKHKNLEREVFGIKFPNPIGLAAGFDKNADFIDVMPAFGFGFLEIGTVTPMPQPGNPKPRLFRLVKDKALINRMGFNNKGMKNAAFRLKKRQKNLIIGGNIGKNKDTPNSKAEDDYLKCFNELYPYVDYFAINVSSPNTPGLRALQEKEPLLALINSLKTKNASMVRPKPILLKIAPDLTNSQLDDIIDIVEQTKLDGLIATNTTILRDGLNTSNSELSAIGDGGLSGSPLRQRSTEVIRYLRSKNEKIPIIGVGGIGDENSAIEKLKAGANLIQIYSGFIFVGPSLVKRINNAILLEIADT